MTDHECPSCGRSFDSRRGLGVHHSTVHDAQLPNRECDHCAASFHAPYEKAYCSEECRTAGTSRTGSDNPNYRGGTTTGTCDRCGTAFEYYPSEKPGLYCPDCVEAGGWRDPPALEAEENPQWAGGRISVECAICDDTVTRFPSNVAGDVAVCSETCRRRWLSEAFSGEGHPNWAGGGDLAYGPGWAETRRSALERDGYRCAHCGETAAELGRNPDVHHIVPVRSFATTEGWAVTDAHHLSNVVTLCPPCHRRAEFGGLSRAYLRALIDPSR